MSAFGKVPTDLMDDISAKTWHDMVASMLMGCVLLDLITKAVLWVLITSLLKPKTYYADVRWAEENLF